MNRFRKRDQQVQDLYLSGWSRVKARKISGLSNNSMSSISHRLHLFWSLPLEGRKEHHEKGTTPPPMVRVPQISAPKPEKRATKPRVSNEERASRNPVRKSAKRGPSLEEIARRPEYSTAPKQEHRYGRSSRLSEREKRERGVEDDMEYALGGKSSAFPAPSDDLPADIIEAIMKASY